MASELRYSRPALKRDYARAAVGLLMCLGLAALMPARAIAFWPLVATAALFLAFGAITAIKQATVIEFDDTGVRRRLTGPAGSLLRAKQVDFERLDRLVLRYFGRRRDRGRGIFELSIRSGRDSLMVDHSLEGFDELMRIARAAAERRNLTLDAATTANLASLGIA